MSDYKLLSKERQWACLVYHIWERQPTRKKIIWMLPMGSRSLSYRWLVWVKTTELQSSSHYVGTPRAVPIFRQKVVLLPSQCWFCCFWHANSQKPTLRGQKIPQLSQLKWRVLQVHVTNMRNDRTEMWLWVLSLANTWERCICSQWHRQVARKKRTKRGTGKKRKRTKRCCSLLVLLMLIIPRAYTHVFIA